MLGGLGIALLVFASFILFVGICLGDRCDWSEDGKLVFWMVVVGLALIFIQNGR